MSYEDKEEKPDVSWRDTMRFVLHYWKPEWYFGVAAAVLMLFSVGVDAIVPVYTGKIVDAMTSPDVAEGARADAAWHAFVIFAALAVAHQAFRIFSFLFWMRFAVRNLHQVSVDGLYKVNRFSSDWHANSFAGSTVRKITRGKWSMDVFADTLLMGLLPAITIMTGVSIMLFIKLPLVGAITLVMMLLYCAVSIAMSVKLLAPLWTKAADADSAVGGTLADIITGNPSVKSFGAEAREDTIFEDISKKWWKKAFHAWQISVYADAFRSGLRLVLTASMVAATVWLWQTGKATPGDIALVITTFFIIGGYLRDIGRQIADLQRSASEMADVVSFWLEEEDVKDKSDAGTLQVSDAQRDDMIAFDTVGFRYPNGGRWIYRGMNVGIRSGENVALVGASGSGKSTFVKLLQRLYDVDEGEICIDGQDISAVTQSSLRQSIALVPQEPILFHRTLADNIAYGRPDA
ncbi:MAG: ABC transporter ATP-binding protein, partial [Alphaproteobacteria bacterium]|nr:ABC transporter ATP-binding protein [Alphaproteobacteria bacterium]